LIALAVRVDSQRALEARLPRAGGRRGAAWTAWVVAGVLVTALAVIATALPASAAATVQQRFFLSPSGNISCELDLFSATNELAYCQTLSPPASATLAADGHLRECLGMTCLGNPPDGDRKLAYGDSVALGPFRCSSLTTGVRCTVMRSQHGFLISRSGIVRV